MVVSNSPSDVLCSIPFSAFTISKISTTRHFSLLVWVKFTFQLIESQHNHGSGNSDHDGTQLTTSILPPSSTRVVIPPPSVTISPPVSSTSVGDGHDHDHGTPTSSISPPINTGPAIPAPKGCRLIPGDDGFPTATEFSAALPGVMAISPGSSPIKEHKRPQYIVSASTVAQVQAALKFSGERNIRISIYNSGHDFLGFRNPASLQSFSYR